jgi:DNA gyrase subunit A
MMITRHGVIIRVPVEGIRVSGRNTQGVKVMNLDDGDTVVDVTRIVREDDENGNGSDDGEADESQEIVSDGRDQRELDV